MSGGKAGGTSGRPGRAPTRAPASRTPFVLLMVLLLGGGLLGLLLLNTALNQGSFDQSRLKKENAQLSDEEQALRQQLEAVSAPGELARRAEELGMVPGTNPAFIDPVTGQVHGSAKPAAPKPTPTPTPTPVVGLPVPVPVAPAPSATGPGAPPAPTLTTAPTTTPPAPTAAFGPAPR
ncbi:MAG TPA: cell division protein FtsL [Yinghuangia sp.]|uniref:cell division protein FtsL n=1 Tax=Yinghuangia sp. YIM S10712 TaxID=3436930 RepID=UPI002C7AB1CE|nr:cell division protein FtsL [Yinghuangia sp.]